MENNFGKSFASKLQGMADKKEGKPGPGPMAGKPKAAPGEDGGEGPDMAEVKARVEALDPAAMSDLAAELMAGMGPEDIDAILVKYEGSGEETMNGGFDEAGMPMEV